MEQKLKELASSLYFTMALLKECNYKCDYCYPFGQNKVVGQNMSKDEAFSVIDAVFASGFNKVKFTGGEPTLVPWFSEAFEYVMKLNPDASITIITNGTTLEKYLDLFEKYKRNLRLQLSLDTTNPSHKQFGIFKVFDERLQTNMLELQRRGITTRINTVVMKGNKDQVYKMVDLATRFGFSIKLFNLFYQDQYIATDGAFANHGSMKPLEYWKQNYVNLNEFVPRLKEISSKVIEHYIHDGKYGLSYGFIINGVEVLLADTTKGAYYQSEVCLKNCPYFKKLCEKGFYNPHVASNLTLYPDDCFNENLRWNLRGKTQAEKEASIIELLKLFLDVKFVPVQVEEVAKFINRKS